MKRLFYFLILLVSLFAGIQPADAANKMWWATGLTGGSDNLDGIDGATVTAGDGAFVLLDAGSTTPKLYIYRCYESATAEASPNVISPDSNAGDKRWHLVNIVGYSLLTGSSTGVLFSASNGTLTITGQGDGYDESLTLDLNTTENQVTIGTGTGVTRINTALQIAATGYILGPIKVVAKSSDYTIGTDDANEAYGTLFVNTGASTRTFTLPSAVAGMSVCIKNAQGVAQILRLDAGADDYIVMSTGARTSAAAEYYGSTASAAALLCVVAVDTTDWHVMSERGTWAEE